MEEKEYFLVPRSVFRGPPETSLSGLVKLLEESAGRIDPDSCCEGESENFRIPAAQRALILETASQIRAAADHVSAAAEVVYESAAKDHGPATDADDEYLAELETKVEELENEVRRLRAAETLQHETVSASAEKRPPLEKSPPESPAKKTTKHYTGEGRNCASLPQALGLQR